MTKPTSSLFRNDGTPTGISIVPPSGSRTKYVIRVTGNGKDTMFGISSALDIESAYVRAIDERLAGLNETGNETLRKQMFDALPRLLLRHKLKLVERTVWDIVPEDE